MAESTAKEQLMSVLFEDGSRLVNIKFFPGDREMITEEELCGQALSAIRQRQAGTATVTAIFPETARKIDIRDLIAGI